MADAPAFAVLVLAAGASRRMGRPKQLLPVDGAPLVRRVVGAAAASPAKPLVVVLGAHAAEIRPGLEGLAAHVVENAAWAEGMGASIRSGMAALDALAPQAKGVVICLADQPDLCADHIAALIEAAETGGRSIVASVRGGRRMPPVLFAARHFPDLRQLEGDVGARALIEAHAAEVAEVPAEALRDLNTPLDYEEYLSGGGRRQVGSKRLPSIENG